MDNILDNLQYSMICKGIHHDICQMNWGENGEFLEIMKVTDQYWSKSDILVHIDAIHCL